MTDGDYRTWGSQFWWHNQSCYYSALFNLGLLELTDPMIRQIDGMRFWKCTPPLPNGNSI